MFYGWTIVGVAFLTHFISVGFTFYSYGVFFKALTADFGGSRLGIGLGLFIMNVVIAAVSPSLGRALDKDSARRIMLVGVCVMAAGFFLMTQVAALWQFYAVFGSLVAVGSVMMGGLAGSTLVARWFVERRGTALGISAMGVSLSGMVMAPVATQLIEGIGWRGAYLVYGVVTLVLSLPVIWLLVVNRPEDLGLAPDGRPLANAGATQGDGGPVLPLAAEQTINPAVQPEWTFLGIMRVPSFWIISMVIGLTFASLGAVLTHIIPHATDIGLPALQASFVLSSMAGLGVVGKVFFGWIADRIDKRHAIWLLIGVQALGLVLVLEARSYPFLLLAGALFGFGMGGTVPLFGALIGAGFGRHAFGRVMGLMSPFMLPLQALGVPFAGYVFDRTGSYDVAFQAFLGIYALAALIVVFLRLPEVEPGHAALGEESAGASPQ
jgi:MFS family permease